MKESKTVISFNDNIHKTTTTIIPHYPVFYLSSTTPPPPPILKSKTRDTIIFLEIYFKSSVPSYLQKQFFSILLPFVYKPRSTRTTEAQLSKINPPPKTREYATNNQ